MRGKHFEDLPQGRLKIDRLGTGRGRSGPPTEEPQQETGRQAVLRRQQNRRGATPRTRTT